MPDIAKSTLQFPEGKIKLDKVYGAIEPGALQEFADKIPEAVKIIDGYSDTLPALLQNAQERIRLLILKRAAKSELVDSAVMEELVDQAKHSTALSINPKKLLEADKQTAGVSSRDINILASFGFSNALAEEEESYATAKFHHDVEAALAPVKRHIKATEDKLNRLFKTPQMASLVTDVLPEEYDPKRKSAYLATFEASAKAIDPSTTLIQQSYDSHITDLVPKVPDVESFLREESKYRGLFLDELDKMLAEQGHKASSRQLFVEPPKKVVTDKAEEGVAFQAGSQTVIFLGHYFPSKLNELAKDKNTNESTTSYYMFPNFVERDISRGVDLAKAKGDKIVTQPTLMLDAKAVNLLRQHGVSDSAISGWCKNYLRAAAIGEHDYLHRLIIPHQGKAQFLFPDEIPQELMAKSDKIPPPLQPTGHLEDHALATHAQILKRLFDTSPKRKEAVLSRAAEGYIQLHDMQREALAHCQTDGDKFKVNEAITYLAEIQSQRLFRAFAPSDPAFKMPVPVETADGKKPMSVADAMNKVTLVSPKGLQATTAGKSNLELLTLHAKNCLGSDTYEAIHTVNSFPMITMKSFLKASESLGNTKGAAPIPSEDKLEIVYKDALSIVADAHKAAIANSVNPKASQALAQERSSQTLKALALRKQGDTTGALRIESALRKPIPPVEPVKKFLLEGKINAAVRRDLMVKLGDGDATWVDSVLEPKDKSHIIGQ